MIADREGERRDDEGKADRQTGPIDQAAQDVAARDCRARANDGRRVRRKRRRPASAWPYGAMSGAKIATKRLIATIARPICAHTLSLYPNKRIAKFPAVQCDRVSNFPSAPGPGLRRSRQDASRRSRSTSPFLQRGCLSRGLDRMARMSAVMLNRINVAAKISPQACTTGTSCFDDFVDHQLAETGIDEDGLDDDDADDEIGQVQRDHRDDGRERIRQARGARRCATLSVLSKSPFRYRGSPSPKAPRRASSASYARQ